VLQSRAFGDRRPSGREQDEDVTSKRIESQVAVDVADARPLPPLEPKPPAWVARLTETRPDRWLHVHDEVANVHLLDVDALEAQVTAAYQRLALRLRDAARHPVRFWNFLPGIHEEMSDGLDRYMVFNGGRFAAFQHWFGAAAAFDRRVPTASAVGIDGARTGALIIHALAAAEAGAPIENPRQIPAYSYSRRYGPLPPCFARATRVDAGDGLTRLLIGGTASIVGEDSQHERDARRQTLETLDNLARLIRHAREIAGDERHGDPLDDLTDLRVYIVRDTDTASVRELLAERLPATTQIELAQADLCRRELLVEIEGIALL
jgi:chorismate lyase/3-hydroxybenzoate synthase